MAAPVEVKNEFGDYYFFHEQKILHFQQVRNKQSYLFYVFTFTRWTRHKLWTVEGLISDDYGQTERK